MSNIEESFQFILNAFKECDNTEFYERLESLESPTDIEDVDCESFVNETSTITPDTPQQNFHDSYSYSPVNYSEECEQKLHEQTLYVLRVIFCNEIYNNKKANKPVKQHRKKKRKCLIWTKQVETSYKRKSNHSPSTSAQNKLCSSNIQTCNAATIKALSVYLTKRKASYQPISIDHIHNLILYNKTVDDACALTSNVPEVNTYTNIDNLKAIEIIAFKLVESLWKCVQYTPYIRNTKRRSEVFRPFAAGVVFAMRRGIQLACGAYIVPRCKEIERVLDEITSVQRGTERHSIHLLAHRGVNVLQRCILSIEDPNTLSNIFSDAIDIASNFDNACRTCTRAL